uniref:Major facilitator superfamily (MFS) profile domain-containing protein n=1 Tax=Kalanchoe fedtschenkoi TaxID=63787 RepID=A0A7N0UGD9_KALFE
MEDPPGNTNLQTFTPAPPHPDELIQQTLDGGVSWFQIIQILLVSSTRVFDGQQTFIPVFVEAIPEWHCKLKTGGAPCSSDTRDICRNDPSSWDWKAASASSSIISEWNLQCKNPILMGLGASSFFAGCLLGGLLFPPLSDTKVGRRHILFISSLSMSVASLTTISATSIWSYSGIRFLTGLCRSSIGSCAIVLVTEKIGSKWKPAAVMVCYLCFSIGILTLPAIAYYASNHHNSSSWRELYKWTSIPGIACNMIAYLLVAESPEWLLSKGRGAEALVALKQLAPWIDDETTNYVSISAHNTATSTTSADIKTSFTNYFSSLRLLFGLKHNLRRIIPIIVLAFGIGLVYFGIPLGVGNLGFDTYVGTVLNAVIEIPAFVIALYLTMRGGKEYYYSRRGSLAGFCMASGAMSVTCTFVPAGSGRLGVELGAFVMGCVACNVMAICTTQLFQVKVRNTAVGVMWEAMTLAGVLAPVFVKLGKQQANGFLSYGIFGIVIMVCGLFASMLPSEEVVTAGARATSSPSQL